MHWTRLQAISRKEWTQLFRDPRSLIVIVVQPMVLLILYGYAMDLDLKNVALAVYDQDRSAASRALVRGVDESPYFDVRGRVSDPRQIEDALDRGLVRFILVIPAGFERDLAAGRPAAVQALFDGADANTAGIALGYTQALLIEEAHRLVQEARQRRPVSVQAVGLDVRTTVLYNPALDSTFFLVPGLIAVILSMLSALLTSGTIVRERERGTLEQLVASPLHPTELMLGKLLPYVFLSLFDLLLVMGMGWLLFGVWPQGSVLTLLGLTLLFLPCALGLGMLISTIARTQQMALVAAFVATVLPSILLSGFVFSRQNMPQVLQLLSQLIPATHYLLIIRGIYLKGVGLAVLWPQALILLVFSGIVVALSSKRFTKRLE